MTHEKFWGDRRNEGGDPEADTRDVLEQIGDVVRPIAAEAKMLRIMKEARIEVQRVRKEFTGPSPFNNASHAIDRVVAEYRNREALTDDQMAALYNDLNKMYLEPLAEVEARLGRTDWTVPPLE